MLTKRRVVPLAAAAMLALAIATAGASRSRRHRSSPPAWTTLATSRSRPTESCTSSRRARRLGSVWRRHPARSLVLRLLRCGHAGSRHRCRRACRDRASLHRRTRPRPWGPWTSHSPAARSTCSASDLVAATRCGPPTAPRRGCSGPWSPASSSRTAIRCSPTCSPTRWRPTPTARTSTPTRWGWSARATATSGRRRRQRRGAGIAQGHLHHDHPVAPRSALAPPFLGLPPHADPDGRRADLGGAGARRRVLHQPADGLPVREGRCQHLARRSRPARDGLRLGAHQPHRSGVRARRVALRGGDLENGLLTVRSARW